MGFKSHDYLWVLSPFDAPYDSLSHIILGGICGFKINTYGRQLFFVLITYQILNSIYGDEGTFLSRIPSLTEYTIGGCIGYAAKSNRN